MAIIEAPADIGAMRTAVTAEVEEKGHPRARFMTTAIYDELRYAGVFTWSLLDFMTRSGVGMDDIWAEMNFGVCNSQSTFY